MRLKNCILSKEHANNSTYSSLTTPEPEKKKIAAVEELLENILLFLSGVGVTGYLTYILQRMASFVKFLRFLMDKIELVTIALSSKLKRSD